MITTEKMNGYELEFENCDTEDIRRLVRTKIDEIKALIAMFAGD